MVDRRLVIFLIQDLYEWLLILFGLLHQFLILGFQNVDAGAHVLLIRVTLLKELVVFGPQPNRPLPRIRLGILVAVGFLHQATNLAVLLLRRRAVWLARDGLLDAGYGVDGDAVRA